MPEAPGTRCRRSVSMPVERSLGGREPEPSASVPRRSPRTEHTVHHKEPFRAGHPTQRGRDH